MSASQRRKGAGGERELCGLLTDALGIPVKRLLGQARDGGHDITLPPFRIECKRRSRIGNLYAWLRQTQCEGVDGVTPAVALRADGEGWLVVLRLPDFIRLAREEIARG